MGRQRGDREATKRRQRGDRKETERRQQEQQTETATVATATEGGRQAGSEARIVIIGALQTPAQQANPLSQSLTHSLIDSFIHSFIHACTLSPHLMTRHPTVHSSICPCRHPSIHPSIHPALAWSGLALAWSAFSMPDAKSRLIKVVSTHYLGLFPALATQRNFSRRVCDVSLSVSASQCQPAGGGTFVLGPRLDLSGLCDFCGPLRTQSLPKLLAFQCTLHQ